MLVSLTPGENEAEREQGHARELRQSRLHGAGVAVGKAYYMRQVRKL